LCQHYIPKISGTKKFHYQKIQAEKIFNRKNFPDRKPYQNFPMPEFFKKPGK